MSFSSRTELLLGQAVVASLRIKRIILFGTGGVGSWCAESLIRTGVEQLTIVDGDIISPSNINRQVMATSKTVGLVKAEVMKERLLDINPNANVIAIHRMFTPETASEFNLCDYDYIIDCIDSVNDKMTLLLSAADCRARVFSSMGAACKTDPARIRTAEFWKVKGCPLGAALRSKMRHCGAKPAKPVTCVYSEEQYGNKGENEREETLPGEGKANGSIVQVTAVFGFTLAALVVEDIINNAEEKRNDE